MGVTNPKKTLADMSGKINAFVVVLSIIVALGIYGYLAATVPGGILLVTKATQYYALAALTFLYAGFVIEPLNELLKLFPINDKFFAFRRGLVIGSLMLALIHSSLGFFGELGGLGGLFFLDNRYLLAIGLAASAELILIISAFAFFDFIRSKVSGFWLQILTALAYLAGSFILIHALMLGSHFSDLSETIPVICTIALAILLVLEANRVDKLILTRVSHWPKVGALGTVVIGLVVYYWVTTFSSPTPQLSINVHAQHIALAQQALQGNVNSQLSNLPTIPSLQGDRTRRFTASFIAPEKIMPGQDTQLKFKIFDASSGNQTLFFQRVYAYPMHLIIVDSALGYFEHIHPVEDASGEFTITTQLPKKGLYHLYIQFQPIGAIEQQMAFTLKAGMQDSDQVELSDQPVDSQRAKIFGDYEVRLDTHGTLWAKDMTIGKDKLTFTILDAKTKQPITTLKPFMASFGHLTMINEKTYDFIHVHPYNVVAPLPDANGGPSVDFLPIGIYGPFKPGIYRAFGEFSTKIGTDFDSDFTVEVK